MDFAWKWWAPYYLEQGLGVFSTVTVYGGLGVCSTIAVYDTVYELYTGRMLLLLIVWASAAKVLAIVEFHPNTYSPCGNVK